MTRISAAVTKVGNVEFTVVSVRSTTVSSMAEANDAIEGLSRYFPGRPIVLAARVGSRNKYVGRRDLTQFLARTAPDRLPWKTYTFTE
jgi:hypothetical protein